MREWLRDQSGGRLFLWVHYFDSHSPYFPPEPYRLRFHPEPVARKDLVKGFNANQPGREITIAP